MKAELKIKNFRSLKNIKVDIRPTMFLLGPNGAGKSTFIKALTFLSENINSDEEKILFNFPHLNIDLKSFENIAEDKNKDIEFEFTFEGVIDLYDFMIVSRGGGMTL